jgi:RNA polymerase sigma factor (sigma-70 family)
MAGYVRTLIDEAAEYESEDIVQDVALNLFSLGNITAPVEDIASYVYQALRNRVVDRFRRRKDMVSMDREITDDGQGVTFKDLLYDERADTERGIHDNEMKQRLYQEIDTLPPDQKTVLIATEFNGKSFAELSKRWRVPIGTLLARKSRAIARLRQVLSDKEP